MKHVRFHHYFIAVALCSAYCIGVIHLWTGGHIPAFFDHTAHYMILPIILPFMLYQETIYLTPAVRDFPYLMAIYPIYFAILLSPLAWIAMKNKQKTAEQVRPAKPLSAAG